MISIIWTMLSNKILWTVSIRAIIATSECQQVYKARFIIKKGVYLLRLDAPSKSYYLLSTRYCSSYARAVLNYVLCNFGAAYSLRWNAFLKTIFHPLKKNKLVWFL